MKSLRFDPSVLANPSWRHWAVTVPLLAASLAGAGWGAPAALLLCAGMALFYFVQLRRLRPLPVQVRVAYFLWLLAGTVPGMRWMHVIALVGTTAMVLFGYCPLARMLQFLWYNRIEPLTVRLAQQIVLAPPSGGLIVWPVSHPRPPCRAAHRVEGTSCTESR